MSKRLLPVTVSLLLTSAIVISGCSSNGSQESSPVASEGASPSAIASTQSDAKPVTIRLMTRYSDESPASAAFRDRVEQFKKENPNITVVDDSTNDEAAYSNKMKTGLATGDLPDVFQTYGGAGELDYAKNNVYADLSDALDQDPAWKDGFLNLFDNWQYSEVEGTYGVPYEFYAVALFYNKDLLANVNNEPPQTVEDLLAVSDKLSQAGIVPMAVGEKDAFKGSHLFTNIFIKKYGIQALKDLGTRKLIYSGPEVVDAFTLMKQMNDKGIFGKNSVGVDYNAEKAMFLNGETAFHYDGSWFLSEADASAINDKIGVVAMPYFKDKPENKDVYMGGAGGGISVSGAIKDEKKDAAIKLLKFLTSKEHFEYIQKTTKGGVFPVKIQTDAGAVEPVTSAYSNLVATAKEFSAESYEPLPEVTAKLRDGIQGLFAGNDPQKAADEIAALVK